MEAKTMIKNKVFSKDADNELNGFMKNNAINKEDVINITERSGFTTLWYWQLTQPNNTGDEKYCDNCGKEKYLTATTADNNLCVCIKSITPQPNNTGEDRCPKCEGKGYTQKSLNDIKRECLKCTPK